MLFCLGWYPSIVCRPEFKYFSHISHSFLNIFSAPSSSQDNHRHADVFWLPKRQNTRIWSAILHCIGNEFSYPTLDIYNIYNDNLKRKVSKKVGNLAESKEDFMQNYYFFQFGWTLKNLENLTKGLSVYYMSIAWASTWCLVDQIMTMWSSSLWCMMFDFKSKRYSNKMMAWWLLLILVETKYYLDP